MRHIDVALGDIETQSAQHSLVHQIGKQQDKLVVHVAGDQHSTLLGLR
jgi:hypothetical protein